MIFAQNEMNCVQKKINFVQNRMSFVQNEIIMLKMIFKKLNLRIFFLILSVFEDAKAQQIFARNENKIAHYFW